MTQERLNQVIEMIEMMAEISIQETAITVWDLEGTAIYIKGPKDFPISIEEGYKHPDKNDNIFKVMSTGRSVYNVVPKEVFGVSIEGKIAPVYDEGRVVGCIASSSISQDKELMQEKNAVIREIHGSIDELENNVQGVYDVVDSIKKNTASIKMLALNASIEAARAGEYGRGFTIVAHEMGKLSQMSSESITGINGTLDNITKSIKNVTGLINKID